MAVQDEQLAALQAVRDKIAYIVRPDCLKKREVCDHAVQAVDLELRRISNRLANLAIQRQNCEQSVRSLTDAWLGKEIPELIREELDERGQQLKQVTDSIGELENSQKILNKKRNDRSAALQLEQTRLDKVEAELRQVDQRITEIRDF